jgi:hypothetical protein
MQENDSGISERFKYRIRFYNQSSNILKLERKEKKNGRCHKESCLISQEQYFHLVTGNIHNVVWNTEEPLLIQFCMQCFCRDFRPKAIIDYERIAYLDEITNIRITIDKNISVGNDIDNFLISNYIHIPVQEKGMHILEIKFDYILPGYIRQIITNNVLVQTSFSKYYLGRQILQRS